MIDSHLHLVDFLQRPRHAADLLARLDAGGIDRAVVFGLPVRKKWSVTEPVEPGYYLDDNAPVYYDPNTDHRVQQILAELPAASRSRLAPLICGFDPTDRLAAAHLAEMTARYDGWRGIGELLLRHDDLTNLTYGETARAGHLALDDVLDFARGRDWPVSVHQDSSSTGRPDLLEYTDELRAMLDRHPGVDVVWCHAGVSRTTAPAGTCNLLAELLAQHRRLHVDLSWALYDMVLPGGQPDPAWLRLIRRHPDRFVLGSDAVGPQQDPGPLLHRFDPLLNALDPTDREMLADTNAARLWFP